MIEFLTYDLKVAVLLAVFYMFYRLMLARETFHRVNRIVLLLTAVASYVLPLCVITIHETVVMQRAAHVAVGSFQVDMMNEEPATPLWQIILPIRRYSESSGSLGIANSIRKLTVLRSA